MNLSVINESIWEFTIYYITLSFYGYSLQF